MVLELTIGGPAYYHNHFCCCTCGGNDHENFCCFVSDVTCEGPKSEPWLLLTCDGHVVSFISFSSSKLCTHAEKNNNSSYLFLSIVMFRKWGDVLKRSHALDTRAQPPPSFWALVKNMKKSTLSTSFCLLCWWWMPSFPGYYLHYCLFAFWVMSANHLMLSFSNIRKSCSPKADVMSWTLFVMG